MQIKHLLLLLAILARTKAICDLEVIEDLLGLSDSEDEQDDSPTHGPVSSASNGIKPHPIQEQPQPTADKNSTSSGNSSDAKPVGRHYKLLHRRRYVIHDLDENKDEDKDIPTSRSLSLNRVNRDVMSTIEPDVPENFVLAEVAPPLTETSALKEERVYLARVAEAKVEDEVGLENVGSSNQNYIPMLKNLNEHEIYRTQPVEEGIESEQEIPHTFYRLEPKLEGYTTKRKQFITLLLPQNDMKHQEKNPRKPVLVGLSQNSDEISYNRKYIRLPNRRPYHPRLPAVSENAPAGEEPVAPPRPILSHENLPLIKEHLLYEVAKINSGDRSKTHNIQDEFGTFYGENPKNVGRPGVSLHGSFANMRDKIEMNGGKRKSGIFKIDDRYFPIVVNNPEIIIDDRDYNIAVPVVAKESHPMNKAQVLNAGNIEDMKMETKTEKDYLKRIPPISVNVYNVFKEASGFSSLPMHRESTSEQPEINNLFQHNVQQLPLMEMHQKFNDVSSMNKQERGRNTRQLFREAPLVSINIYNRLRETENPNYNPMSFETIPKTPLETDNFQFSFQQLPFINMRQKFNEAETNKGATKLENDRKQIDFNLMAPPILPSTDTNNKFKELSELNYFPMNHESILEKSHEGHIFQHHFQELPSVNTMFHMFKEDYHGVKGGFGEDHALQGCGEGGCNQHQEGVIINTQEPNTTPRPSTVSVVPKIKNVV